MNQHTYDICRMTLLYVDDDTEMVNMMRYVLARNYLNQKLVFAADGYDALRKSKKYQPDIFLIDLSMPLLDGVRVMEEILTRNKEAEVMVVSATKDPGVVRRCLDLGARHYLTKPISFDELFGKIDSMMERIFWKRLCVAKGINYGDLIAQDSVAADHDATDPARESS